MIFREYFSITGVASSIAYADPLTSTAAEKKRLLSVSIVLTGYAGNQVQGYHERAKVFDMPDVLFDIEPTSYDEDEAKPGARLNEVEIGLEIPVGEAFKAALKCGATNKDAVGCYNYELMA